jgi:hypothetical protein
MIIKELMHAECSNGGHGINLPQWRTVLHRRGVTNEDRECLGSAEDV